MGDGILLNGAPRPDLSRLDDPFPPEDIEWRLDQIGRKRGGELWARVVRYVTARGVASRLDEVVGKPNWRTSFHELPNTPTDRIKENHLGAICRLELRLGGEWVAREDGAPNTQIEPIKGGLSDAFKRAAVQWGIGRWLYGREKLFANIYEWGDQRGRFKASANVKTADGKGEERVWFSWSPPGEEPTAPQSKPAAEPAKKPAPPRASADDVAKRWTERVRAKFSECATAMQLVEAMGAVAATREKWPSEPAFRAALALAGEECTRFPEGDRSAVVNLLGHYLRPAGMEQTEQEKTDGQEAQDPSGV